MKRYILIFLISILISGCITDIEYTPKDSGYKLILNGIIDANKNKHDLYIQLNLNSKNIPVKNAKIEVLVNNKPKNVQIDFEETDYITHCIVHGKFEAGDEVKIEVNAGKFTASAEGVIPKAPNIDNLKSLGQSKCDFYYDSFDTEKYSLDLHDFVNEDNFYQAYAIKHTSLFYLDSEYENNNVEYEDFLRDFAKFGESINYTKIENYIYPDAVAETKQDIKNSAGWNGSSFKIISDDPAISDKASDKFNEEMGFALNTNFYLVFSDNLFHNSKYNLTLNIPEKYSTYHSLNHDFNDVLQNPEINKKPSIILSQIGFGITNMDRETFYYCKAINVIIGKELDDDFGILGSQPPVIPTNVQGGLGFIQFVNSAEVDFHDKMKGLNAAYFLDYFDTQSEVAILYDIKNKHLLMY